MASDPVVFCVLALRQFQYRALLEAAILREGATRVVATAGGHIMKARHVAFDKLLCLVQTLERFGDPGVIR